MKRWYLISAVLSLTCLNALAQETQIQVEVKEKRSEEERQKLPVEKKTATPRTETTIKGEELTKQAGAGSVNIFKAVELTPSLNVQTDDPYGLGGGSIRIRGFDNTQIGVSLDGMPLNDSGNFALYPHEYVDVENLESITVERGAVGKRSPFYVDIGGSIKLRVKPPSNKLRYSYNLSAGSFGFVREYLRLDTGLIRKINLKAFISFSHTSAEKWKGPGKNPDYRDHLAFGLAQNLGRLRWEFYFDNNAQTNYFYRGLNYAQAMDLDRYRRFDYTDRLIFPGGNGTVHNNPAIRDNNLNYYKFYKNPYINREARANIELDVAKNITLILKPYYWYGRGSGTSATTFTSGGNTYIAFRESFNYTDRPGVIAELRFDVPYGELYAGYWYERAELKQWQPSRPVRINPDGSFTLLTNTVGTPRFQYNYIQKTITTTNTPYVFTDLRSLFGGRIDLNLGLRFAQVKRDFTNYSTQGLPYLPEDNIFDYPNLKKDSKTSYIKTYRRILPNIGIGIKLSNVVYPYFAYAKNFRVPQNFIGAIPTNISAQFVADQLKPEESDSYDIGIRFDFGSIYIVPSAYYVKYKNRLIRIADPTDPNLIYLRNAGKVIAYGAELEIGANIFKSLSLYSSFSYNEAKFKDELYYSGNQPINIKDKTVPDTPKYMFKLGMDYTILGFDVRPSVIYMSSRYGNLTNTEKVGGYTLANLYISRDIYKGYANLYIDIRNLFDKKYIGRISVGDTSGTYYVGAPFSVAVGLKGRF